MLTTREGLALIYDSDPFGSVHSIRRVSALVRNFGIGLRLHRDTNGPYVDPISGLVFTGFSGDPLSIVPFQGNDSRGIWSFIADTATMKKAGINANNELYQWGIDPPTAVVLPALDGAGNLNSTVAGAIAYQYRATYMDIDSGAESNPSEVSVDTNATNQSINLSIASSTDPQVDTVRWWRRGGTLIDATFRLIGTSPNATPTWNDSLADSDAVLAKELSFKKFRPFQSVGSDGLPQRVNLPYACSYAGKYILAVGDANRPGYLYWTNAGDPDSADTANNVQITSQSEALTGVFVYDSRPFCFSKDNLHAIDPGQSIVTFRGRVTACGRGCAAPRGFASNGPQIFFLSQDGIYATDGESPAVSLTEESLRPIFNGLTVGAYTPVDYAFPDDIRLWYAAQELHFVYRDTAGQHKHLRWHSAYNRWKSNNYFETDPPSNVAPTTVYEDEGQQSSIVYLGFNSGFIYQISLAIVTDGGTPIGANVRTGSLDFGAPQAYKEFGNLIVDADPQGGSITITPYINAEATALAAQVLTGTGRRKYALALPDVYAYTFAIDLAWEGPATVYQLEILHRQDEEEITHWEYPPTTHGLSGWQQLRDGYIDMRSNAVVLMTVEVDGRVWGPYSIPSTAGARSKPYVQFDAIKGKVFRYSLDSAESFRLYGEDCELRLKPWNTDLGYALMSPFRPTNRETQ